MDSKAINHTNKTRKNLLRISIACVILLLALLQLFQPQERSSEAAQRSGGKARKVQLAAQDVQLRTVNFEKQVVPFLNQYCTDCHSSDDPESGLDLSQFRDFATAEKADKTWQRVLNQIEVGAMPPSDYDPLPTMDERKQVSKAIDRAFFYVNCELLDDPGRVTIRRLNRSEYNNTIRDLIGLDLRPADKFPSDDVGYGFDNIGDVLTVSPLLMAKYIDAAEEIAQKAIFTLDPAELSVVRRSGKALTGQGSHSYRRGRAHALLSNNGVVSTNFEFKRAGFYTLRAEISAQQAGGELAKVEFRIDGNAVGVVEVKGERIPDLYETKIQVGTPAEWATGRHTFSVRFINDYYETNGPKKGDRNVYVSRLEVQSPAVESLADYPEAHRKIIFTMPKQGQSPLPYAQRVLERFATRAYRRPVTTSELNRLMKLVQLALDQNDSYEKAIQVAVQAVLTSPNFLFRLETDVQPDNPERIHKVTDYELASRLSYFLWSSMPDEELFELAEKGKLHHPVTLKQQVTRMLSDRKSQALVNHFAGQWLNLNSLDSAERDRSRFRDFNDQLRADMRRETELLFDTILRENRSILEFIDADYTFVNQRLARLYDMQPVKFDGDEFRKVALADRPRAGMLTHASILTLTSDPTKTSPVKRGKWILDNILGASPPPPPPDVPLLDEVLKAHPNASLKEQLALHRTNATCASCHKLMDPIGFGLENYDAIGRWRERDGKHEIDPSGEFPDGQKFKTPLELIEVIKSKPNQFAKHLTSTMLTYALGRGLQPYDKCTIDEITINLERNNYRFRSLVEAIVLSKPFLMRRGDGGSS